MHIEGPLPLQISHSYEEVERLVRVDPGQIGRPVPIFKGTIVFAYAPLVHDGR